MNTSIKWEVLLRYRFIEIIAQWEGRLTTNHLCNTFNIQRQQASKDISQYKEQAPENLTYDAKFKGYAPSKSFKPILTRGQVDEYLNLLDSHSLLDGFIQKIDIADARTEIIRAPHRRVDPLIVRKVVEACRTKQRIELTYASMTNPTGEERIIVPHTIVSSGYRWHVRAFCEKNMDYRDFVLGRILECGELMGKVSYEQPRDALWDERIDLELIANPNLTPDQQKLVKHERGFDQQLTVRARKATAIYALQLLQVPTSAPTDNPADAMANPLILKNYNQINELRFERKNV